MNKESKRPFFTVQSVMKIKNYSQWSGELEEKTSEDYDPYQYVYDAEDNITNDNEILIEFEWE